MSFGVPLIWYLMMSAFRSARRSTLLRASSGVLPTAFRAPVYRRARSSVPRACAPDCSSRSLRPSISSACVEPRLTAEVTPYIAYIRSRRTRSSRTGIVDPCSTFRCACESMSPGMMVLPDTSIRVVPAGILTDVTGPTASSNPLRMTTVPFSIAALPVPSITRAPVRATVLPEGACASDGRNENAATSNMPAAIATRRVETRIILHLLELPLLRCRLRAFRLPVIRAGPSERSFHRVVALVARKLIDLFRLLPQWKHGGPWPAPGRRVVDRDFVVDPVLRDTGQAFDHP